MNKQNEGILALDKLLREMRPELAEPEYVICSVAEGQFQRELLSPLLVFKEAEGITILLERKQAEQHNIPYRAIWRLITLRVHSSLSAVGFLARITQELAKADISVNVVSAFYHDHLLVPEARADDTMAILRELSKAGGT